jgi:hypothetical protein
MAITTFEAALILEMSYRYYSPIFLFLRRRTGNLRIARGRQNPSDQFETSMAITTFEAALILAQTPMEIS